MDSEFAFRANIASSKRLSHRRSARGGSDGSLAEPLATEPNSDSDDGRPEAEETQATVGNEPLSIHLNEIRSFQLLTHQQEIDIAKLREDGESKNLESILSMPVAFRHVLDLADKVQNNEIRLSDVIEKLTREDDTAGAPVKFQLDTRDAFLKSARSIKRRLRNIEAAAAQSAGKKNVPRSALVAAANYSQGRPKNRRHAPRSRFNTAATHRNRRIVAAVGGAKKN